MKNRTKDGLILANSSSLTKFWLCRNFGIDEDFVEITNTENDTTKMSLIKIKIPIKSTNDYIGNIKHFMHKYGYYIVDGLKKCKDNAEYSEIKYKQKYFKLSKTVFW